MDNPADKQKGWYLLEIIILSVVMAALGWLARTQHEPRCAGAQCSTPYPYAYLEIKGTDLTRLKELTNNCIGKGRDRPSCSKKALKEWCQLKGYVTSDGWSWGCGNGWGLGTCTINALCYDY